MQVRQDFFSMQVPHVEAQAEKQPKFLFIFKKVHYCLIKISKGGFNTDYQEMNVKRAPFFTYYYVICERYYHKEDARLSHVSALSITLAITTRFRHRHLGRLSSQIRLILRINDRVQLRVIYIYSCSWILLF